MGGALSGPYTLLLGPVLLEISTSLPVKKIATKRSRKPYRRDARKKSKNNEGARITTSPQTSSNSAAAADGRHGSGYRTVKVPILFL